MMIRMSEMNTPIPFWEYFNKRCILKTIAALKPHKALSPDGIPNIVLMKCANNLADHLYIIYRTVFKLDVYHDSWLVSTTLVLRQPG